MIPYGRQDILPGDIDAVVEVLKSDFLTQGPAVPAFEADIANLAQSSYAVAVNSATSALHIAYLALGLGPGDLLWTSPITFVATSNAALYCGADVDFVDIEKDTFGMCPSALQSKLEEAAAAGRLPKIVAPVHLCGQSCDMARIRELGDEYGFSIVEDASHAVGAKYKQSPVGSCEFSDIAVFSFHPVKIITTGEGGMATTNDEALYRSMSDLRSHGITRDKARLSISDPGGWYYEQLGLGFNYRMTDIQAALGRSQAARLDGYVEKRNELAARYNEGLSDLPILVPSLNPDCYSSFHLYVIRIPESSGTTRRAVYDGLRERDVGVNVHYIPVHHHPYYRDLGFDTDRLANSEEYYRQAISIPLYPGLSYSDQDYILNCIEELMA